jgi:hypothetical protein
MSSGLIGSVTIVEFCECPAVDKQAVKAAAAVAAISILAICGLLSALKSGAACRWAAGRPLTHAAARIAA